jgi:uncharacterized protein involved in exopolysaccharide biosynthesis
MIEENKNSTPIGIEFIKVTLRHKFLIGFVVLIAVISAVIFTSPFFIKPMFKAEAIIYPPSSNTSSALISSDMRFGSEMDIDNQIQVLQSTILRDSIVHKYNLFNHYGIDTTSSKRFYLLNKEYASNVNIERTRYNSISVVVYDIDPVTAAHIANDIVKIGDEVKAGIIKKNLKTAFKSVGEELESKSKDIADISGMISGISRRGQDSFTPIPSQSGMSLQSLKSRYQSELIIYNSLKSRYELAQNNLNSDFPASYVISPAESSMVKVYPQRTIIVSIVAVCAYFLTVLFFILSKNLPEGLDHFDLK